jgi:nicotinamide-nucleotide amidase
MDAEIIAVGSELLTPQYTDTNSLYLTEKLNALGILVRFKTIVGDSTDDLGQVFRTALGRSPLIILTGGLGPTEDDLTRLVVAKSLDRRLHEVAEIRSQIEKRYARLGRARRDRSNRWSWPQRYRP